LGSVVALVDRLVSFIHLPPEAVQSHTQAVCMDPVRLCIAPPKLRKKGTSWHMQQLRAQHCTFVLLNKSKIMLNSSR